MKNKDYNEARNKLIPSAIRQVEEKKNQYKALGKKWNEREQLPYYFTEAMTKLAIENNLINEGCLTLFYAKDLPSWENPNNRRK